MSPQRTASKSSRRTSKQSSNGNKNTQSRSTHDGQAQSAKRETEKLADKAQDKAHQLKESVQEQTHEAWEKGKRELHEQTEHAKAKGESLVNQQKERVADEVSTFGTAIREAASRLHEEDDDTVAHYADMAAERMDSLSQYLRGRDANRLLHDTEELARSRPELVYGGLFIAGLGIARFLKASGSRRSRNSQSAQQRRLS